MKSDPKKDAPRKWKAWAILKKRGGLKTSRSLGLPVYVFCGQRIHAEQWYRGEGETVVRVEITEVKK